MHGPVQPWYPVSLKGISIASHILLRVTLHGASRKEEPGIEVVEDLLDDITAFDSAEEP